MDRTEVDFEQLNQIARKFESEKDDLADFLVRFRGRVEDLQYEGWVGTGSDKFFDEMYEEIFPALDRLIHAVNEAALTTRKISHIYSKAQLLAARGFYSTGEVFLMSDRSSLKD